MAFYCHLKPITEQVNSGAQTPSDLAATAADAATAAAVKKRHSITLFIVDDEGSVAY